MTKTTRHRRWQLLAAMLLGAAVLLAWGTSPGSAQETGQVRENANAPTITGLLIDSQRRTVAGASVELVAGTEENLVAETESQPSGAFVLTIPEQYLEGEELAVVIERPHYVPRRYELGAERLAELRDAGTVALPVSPLEREISLAFWIATLTFGGVLALVALEVLHNTLAGLSGVAIVFASSYLGGQISDELFIFEFERALTYIDWEVIFLVMGMMIVMAVVEGSGIFQWLAYFAYRMSRGKPWLLVIILMIITAIASAFLDNVTTMLLMTSITIRIALAMELNPLPLLLPEVFASNVGGIATLIGTPTNILIGSYAGISFSSFIINLTPGVLMAMVALVVYVELVWFRAYRRVSTSTPDLEERLEEQSKITEPDDLKKAGWVGVGMLFLFLFGERFHLTAAVTALMGATALLVWIRPDVEAMIEAVDWTTLVFFMSLFMLVGAIQEVGLLAWVAVSIADFVGTNLTLAMLAIIWAGAFMSMAVDNIPFTAAMLPVVGFLSDQIPGAEGKMLFFALSVGSAMGGNGTLIGSSPNLVTAGIAERAGYPISYGTFLKYGLPAAIVTLSFGSLWLLIRF